MRTKFCLNMSKILLWGFLCCTVYVSGHRVQESHEIRTFHMHEQCGEKINLKWESIFTAKIELRPFDIVVNPNVTENDQFTTYPDNSSQVCELRIESWDFQNRIMVNFEEVELGNDTDCERANMEILDGLDGRSPRLTGLPTTICSFHANKLKSRSFVTSDKHLTIRFHGDGTRNKNIIFRAVVVAFNDGPCRSYEYECLNFRCIMPDLLCNGHNPCGDNSDCPKATVSSVEVASDDDSNHVLSAAIIAIATTLVFFVIVVVVTLRCYRIRRKQSQTQRLRHLSEAAEAPLVETVESTNQAPNLGTAYQRTISQIERERRFAPPSYSTLPECGREPKTIKEESDEEADDKCFDPSSNDPPSYACVLLHHEDYHVSESSLPEVNFDVDETGD